MKTSELRQRVSGRIVTPEDHDYDQLRAVVYGGFDNRPRLIVRVADAADVAQVVTYARETGLPLSIRGGGHSNAGHSIAADGVVIDLREMKGLDIDVAGRTAWADAGVTAGEYTAATGEHGLTTGFGDTGSVGVPGITLNGGIGFLVRKHGLTIDSLLAAEIVTADGQIRVVDGQSEPDLFWAIRGGGGNFGVVTRLKLQLHEVPDFTGGLMILPATPEVITGFVAAADAAPEELSGMANVMTAPPLPFLPAELHGKVVVMAMLAYAGPADEAQEALAPFRALATPLVDMIRPQPYSAMFPPEDGSYRPLAVGRTLFLDAVDESTAGTILKYLNEYDSPFRVTQIRVLGGAMARVPSDATAFAHRQSRIMANVASFYETEADKARRVAWVEEFADTIRQGDQGAYVGFLADEGEVSVRRAYPGSTWDRLAEIKWRYDPDNMFRFNQNIQPQA